MLNEYDFSEGIRGPIEKVLCHRCGRILRNKSGGEHSFAVCIKNLRSRVDALVEEKELLEHRIEFEYKPTLRNTFKMFVKWMKGEANAEETS